MRQEQAGSGARESATCQQDRELRRFSEQRLLSLKQTRYSKKRRMPPMRHHMHTRTRTHHSAWTAAQTMSTLLSPPPKSGPSVHESPWHSLSPGPRSTDRRQGAPTPAEAAPSDAASTAPEVSVSRAGRPSAGTGNSTKQHGKDAPSSSLNNEHGLDPRQSCCRDRALVAQSRRLSPFQRSWHPS